MIDDDQPGLLITQSGPQTQVVEGGATDSYTVRLTHAPNAGEHVTVALLFDSTQLRLFNGATPITSLSFDASNWAVAQTVTVQASDDSVPENELFTRIAHVVSSDGGLYAAGIDSQVVTVDVRDNDAGSLLVTQTGGTTLVSVGHPDFYFLSLTKAPAHGTTVVVSILTDGKTTVAAAPGGLLPGRFSTAGGTPTVTFDEFNWNVPFKVQVDAVAGGSGGGSPIQTFPAQPHVVQNIFGPLVIEGGKIEDRTLRPGAKLPTETDVPLPVLTINVDESLQTDTLNVFNDGSVSADTGTLGPISASQPNALQTVYGHPVTSTEFGSITGLGMSTGLSLDFGTPGHPDVRPFDGGITYHDIEVVDVLLGRNNDHFNVAQTVAGSITVVQGGGGNDVLTANAAPGAAVGGAGSPLILLGDTTQDGSFYDSITTHITGHGRQFPCAAPFSCNDTIDASGATGSVTIYGGVGNDTITGSQYGDHLAGGSGDDTIHGLSGNDHIYGDNGFNLDLTTRLSLSTQILRVASANGSSAFNADPLVVGNDAITGDDGNDIVVGDFGRIDQAAGTNRILTTGAVATITTVRPGDGGTDTINGNNGNDIILGGNGADVISGDAGNDILIGDNGIVDYASAVDPSLATLDTVRPRPIRRSVRTTRSTGTTATTGSWAASVATRSRVTRATTSSLATTARSR